MQFFADHLSRFDGLALIEEGGDSVSYAELARRGDDFARRIGATQRLVLLEATNSIASVIALVGCLRARHPVIIGSAAARERLQAAFRPNAIVDGDGQIQTLHREAPQVHPDLAVMLSTSGSTGATKLVRLSRSAINANAASIAEYLSITAAERALTTLPISYSYGLSVLNSHLATGASVVLTDRSVIDERLWDLFEEAAATSIAGVPYTYEMLETAGFRERAPTTLRTMTQAGGRLAPDLVRTYAAWARENGVRFFTMYGQTEATARMAYLPPDLAETHSDCIGRAIPGGRLRVVDEEGAELERGQIGELVYSGPNVMMGYAFEAGDLIRGGELSELKTGDLGQEVAEGIFKVTGRASRFSKIAGLRVGLDEIEALLATHGARSIVAGDDELVAIAICEGDPRQAEQLLAAKTTIPMRACVVFALDEVPRLPSGKVDYREVLAEGRAHRTVDEDAMDQAAEAQGTSPLRAMVARALNKRAVGADDSFASLGGDSLAYVEVSMGIERYLGELPDQWERISIRDLESLAAAKPVLGQKRRFRSVAAEMIIRPVAISTILINHAHPGDAGDWKGGALALLLTAGYNAARFQRDQIISPARWKVIGLFAVRFLIPLYFIMLIYATTSRNSVGILTWLLVSSYFKDPGVVGMVQFWFMQTLFHSMLLVVLAFSIKPIRHYAIAEPWRFGLAFLGAATLLNLLAASYYSDAYMDRHPYRDDAWIYAFALGWLTNDANSNLKRWFCVIVAFVLSAIDWGIGEVHNIYLTSATLVLLFFPRIPVWAPLAAILAVVAQSTFYIYLSQGIAINIMREHLKIASVPVLVLGAFALGVPAAYAWRGLVSYLVRFFHARRSTERAIEQPI